MPALARAWLSTASARRRLARRARPATTSREQLIAQHAPGHSFLDVGCMWSVDGAIAFAAEAAGAAAVTGLDLMPASAAFGVERERRASNVRFVQGDLHDEATLARVRRHDVVWCSGVLYHAPHPLLTLQRLRAVCGELLLLATETIPEVPGVAQACVFYPGLDASRRAPHAAVRPGRQLGLSEPFDPSAGYGNWFWGISRSALRAMLSAAGFEVVRVQGDSFHVTVTAHPA